MTEQQLTFNAALRLSGISLNERDTILALELARETILNPDFDLRDWAKIDCTVKGESPAQPQPKSGRKYSEFTIAPGYAEWPKCC
jgi:hypothetical protein